MTATPAGRTPPRLVREPGRKSHHLRADSFYTRCARQIRGMWENGDGAGWDEKKLCARCSRAVAVDARTRSETAS